MSTRPDHDLEHILTQALREEGDRIAPTDRLEDILGKANAPELAEVRPLRSRRVVFAAAAAALVVAGGVWTVTNRPDSTGRVASPPTSSTPVTGTSPSGPDLPTSPPTGALQARPKSVPVYLVGRDGGSDSRKVLVRVFDRVLLVGPAGPGDLVEQVRTALSLSTTNSATADGVGTIANAESHMVTGVADGDTVVVSLTSMPTIQDEDGARQLLAAWVRTVQGVVNRGDVPVRFEVAAGGQLFGHLPSERSWRQGDVNDMPLASIWIDDPSSSVTGPEATARGVASVFEAALQWELTRGGTVVDSGIMTASDGAPGRGTWQVRLTGLTPDNYELRVWADSAKDGSVAAERRVSFLVTG